MLGYARAFSGILEKIMSPINQKRAAPSPPEAAISFAASKPSPDGEGGPLAVDEGKGRKFCPSNCTISGA